MNETSNTETTPPPIDAATVVVARQGDSGIELLMLRKNSKIHFGGMWVFPGGRVDDADRETETYPLQGFRTAAVREAQEEAGIDLTSSNLSHFSHWLPPPIRPKRFSTQFFFTSAPKTMGDIEIDHGEITEHAWISPAEALERRADGRIEVVTPTFVTLDWLRRFESVEEVAADIGDPICYHTQIHTFDDGSDTGMVALYDGDVSYDAADLHQPGPRRRCYMLDSAWWWEEHDGRGNGPSPAPPAA